MEVNLWGAKIECHIFEHNCGNYLDTRSNIELRIGEPFMEKIVKRINTAIGGCTMFYDEGTGKETVEKYITITEAQQYNYQFSDPRER